jgi:hypothetical protein
MTVVWRDLRPREIDHEILWLSVAAGGGVCAAMALAAPELRVPRCPFKILTGLPCPTCGATRACLALARGDLAAAWVFNPLLVFAGTGALVYLVYAAIVLAARLPRCRLLITATERTALRVAALAVVAANWAYLITSGR